MRLATRLNDSLKRGLGSGAHAAEAFVLGAMSVYASMHCGAGAAFQEARSMKSERIAPPSPKAPGGGSNPNLA